MDVNVYSLQEISNEQILEKIKNKESFVIEKVDSVKYSPTIEALEKIIESQGLKCRVYTIGRIATAGVTAFGGVTGAIGLLSGIAIAAHNIATWNPDYEIGKNILGSNIHVTYKK
ncbi:hypothetical protein BZL41_16995 [Pseudomonas sp. PIC25]|uniref:hypothetical protein n=1 Tax=Pseudomonas sp. PIC25 TaxID=1958773 RepID=UPI000BAB897E|nr:hypothetical protein [Pseudomonas sp. PIC25]PAU59198.1 hypothetical protein BZL41_16995 [Pseudomonas sp. PIC25]